MSAGARYPYAQAHATAEQIRASLAPACERIEIAGSLRRGKPDVGDIELLAIPRFRHVQDLFGSSHDQISELDLLVERLIVTGVLAPRKAVNGRVAGFGPRNKLMLHLPSGIPLDLFTATPASWPMNLLVRTGPAELNIRVMARLKARGYAGHVDGIDGPDGIPIPLPDEAAIFALLGLPYAEPDEREKLTL